MASRSASYFLRRCRPNESTPYLQVARIDGGYLLHHADGVDLEVTEGGARVDITRRDPALSQAHFDHIMLDQLLPLVEAHRGKLSFHGSAVAWPRSALCFLADSGTGKSTLASALVKLAGATFLCDDHVLVEDAGGRLAVRPSYAAVRLWGPSAAALFASSRGDGAKQRFDLPAATEPVPLRAVVLLATAAEDAPPVSIEALGKRDALVGAAVHADRLDPTDRVALQRELDQLTHLVESTPVVRMRVARDFTKLEAATAAIRAWALDSLRP
jgi:hypothetical protein